MRIVVLLLLLALVVLMLAGCAAGPNTAVHTPDSDGHVAGFWLGLWHGMISPLTFIISLFTDSINFYEVHNSGALYNLGFVIGAGILFGGGGSASSRRRD